MTPIIAKDNSMLGLSDPISSDVSMSLVMYHMVKIDSIDETSEVVAGASSTQTQLVHLNFVIEVPLLLIGLLRTDDF